MLIYISINVPNLQNIVVCFEIGFNDQNISLSDYHHSIRKFPPSKFPVSPTCYAIWKPLFDHVTNQKHYISTTTLSMATKLGKLMTYLVGPHSNSHANFNYKALLDHLAN